MNRETKTYLIAGTIFIIVAVGVFFMGKMMGRRSADD